MQLINLPCLATGFLAAVLLLGDICFSMVLFLVDLHKMLGAGHRVPTWGWTRNGQAKQLSKRVRCC